ncbi:hypothetical protein [Streptococcus marmotae]|uniref:hypothetical protein n=1 Tax=Streptococcus marmotae TaxID=1825069 RepID=UPI000B2B7A65|nr:hypothetical protein [Streptococcus marmotae]QBX08745.1 hypothetical protein JavanS293_0008 [Streptococcus satellite phage Javan293]
MVNSKVLPQITEIIVNIQRERKALADYKEKLTNAEQELEQAKNELQKAFSFENDKKVIELENFVSRSKHNYTTTEQAFSAKLPENLRELEKLFDFFVAEKWETDAEVQNLEARLVASFKETVTLMNQYMKKPEAITKQAMSEVITPEFKQAFAGQMHFLGASPSSLTNALPFGFEIYQALFEAGRKLGAPIE